MRKSSNNSILHPCGAEGYVRWLSAELTYRCQNQCAWCYNPQCRGKRSELSVDLWSKIITEAAALGTEVVVFTGGEPLLIPFIDQLVGLATELGLLAGLVSNGELLPDRASSLLHAGLGLVWISFVGHNAKLTDSITERRGSFQFKIKALRSLRESAEKNDIILIANIVVEPRNYQHVYSMLELLADEGVHVAYVEEVVSAGKAISKPCYFLKEGQRQAAIAQLKRAQKNFPSLMSLTRTLSRPPRTPRPLSSGFFNVTPDGFLTKSESDLPTPELNAVDQPLSELLAIIQG